MRPRPGGCCCRTPPIWPWPRGWPSSSTITGSWRRSARGGGVLPGRGGVARAGLGVVGRGARRRFRWGVLGRRGLGRRGLGGGDRGRGDVGGGGVGGGGLGRGDVGLLRCAPGRGGRVLPL